MTGPMQSAGIPDNPQEGFPDWSSHRDLTTAARAFLRDPEEAIDALEDTLRDRQILAFTMERFVNDVGVMWQEVAVCDGSRLVLWHGEDVPKDVDARGAMASSVRVIPLSAIAEVVLRRRLVNDAEDPTRRRLDGVDVLVVLHELDEAGVSTTGTDSTAYIRHDALRFGKAAGDGETGQMRRLIEFATTLSSFIGK